MSTGYTSILNDKPSYPFKNFALDCARAFGACVTLRDLPAGGDYIPEKFEESAYHTEEYDKACKAFMEFDNMPVIEQKKLWEDDYLEDVKLWQERSEKENTLFLTYCRMKREVEFWNPPTKEHEGLKKFMLEQLDSSIKFDCSAAEYKNKPTKKSFIDWRNSRLKSLQWDIDYHLTSNKKEKKAIEGRNKWIKNLIDSL
jgi:hypothetical protein